jgi:outer membrane protein assembly factor BamB
MLFAMVSWQPATAEDWPMYLHDAAHSSFNDQEWQLDVYNVTGLAPKWIFRSGGPIASGVTLSDGRLYFGNWNGDFFALDAMNGSPLWTAHIGMSAPPDDPVCQAAIGVSAQPAIDGENVYAGGGDSAIYAFNRITGTLLWRIPLADPASGNYIWSSITISGRSLYVGVSSLGDCPLVRGQLVRIDLDTQSTSVQYLYPGDDVGGGVWSTPAVDESTNTVFVTTGTGEQDARTGKWGGTMLSLDANTLEPVAYFFLPSNSAEDDIEWGSSPALAATTDGTPIVVASGKDGVLYANRRDDLSPLWALKMAVECIAPEQGCGSLSTPAFDGSILYAGAGAPDPDSDDNGSLYAVDPSTGSPLWMRSFDGVVIAPVTVANGVLFVATTSGLKIFEASSGASLWDDGQRGLSYGQAIVAGGVVYSTYISGELVAWTADAAASQRSKMRSRSSGKTGLLK